MEIIKGILIRIFKWGFCMSILVGEVKCCI